MLPLKRYHLPKISSTKITKTFVFCIILCISTVIDARKSSGSSNKRTNNGAVSVGRVTKPQQFASPSIASLSYGPGQIAQARPQPSAPKFADPAHAQLSYGANQAPSSKQTIQPAASAPNTRPVGWNVNGNEAMTKPSLNSATYPAQNTPLYPANPPLYPSVNNGPPPAHSQYPQSQVPPGFQPQGSFPNGQPSIVNNYYGSHGNQGSSGGSGLQTAILAGVGGLALYGALKPSESKTIIINNTAIIVPQNATVPEGAVVLPVNATLPPGVETLQPLQVATDQPVLLAAYPNSNETVVASTIHGLDNSTDVESTSSNPGSVLLAGYNSSAAVTERLEVPSTNNVLLMSTPYYQESTPKPVALPTFENEAPKVAKSNASLLKFKLLAILLPILKFAL